MRAAPRRRSAGGAGELKLARLCWNRRFMHNPPSFMLQARGTALAAAVLVLAAYVTVMAAMPKHVFWSPDEGAKFIQAQTLRWNGGFEYALPYAARPLDPNLNFYPSRCRHDDIYPDPSRGEIRLHWPIWFPLAAQGLHSLFGVTGLYLLPLLGGWLTAVLSGSLVRPLYPRLAPLAILVVGLASPIFFYSLCFWEHTPATLFGIAALAWLARRRPGDLPAWWVAAPLLGLSVLLRVEMVAFGVALVAAWGVTSWKDRDKERGAHSPRAHLAAKSWPIVLGSAVVAVSIVALFAFVLTPRHWESEPLHQGLLAYTLGKSPALPRAATAVFVNSAGHQAPIVGWHWELLVLLGFLALLVAGALRDRAVHLALLIPGVLICVAFSLVLLFSPEPYISLHGFVPIAPYVALASYGAVFAWRHGPPPLSLVAATGAFYLALGFAAIFTFFVKRDGGYLTGLEWGTRNLLTLYPIAAVLALVGVESFRGAPRRPRANEAAAVVAATVLIALSFQVRGAQMLVASHRLVADWQAALPEDEPIFTDVWWLPAAMAPFFVDHPVLCARAASDVGRWIPAARRHGIERFTFASLTPIPDDSFGVDGTAASREGERVVSGLHVKRFRIAGAGP
jgi:hypothetical protein